MTGNLEGDRRQDCADTAVDPRRLYERAAWRPQRADCPLFPRSGRHACPGLAGQSVVVLGDSMARNFYEALDCRLRELDVNSSAVLRCCQINPNDTTRQENIISPETISTIPAKLAEARSWGDSVQPLGVLVVSTGPWWRPALFLAPWGATDGDWGWARAPLDSFNKSDDEWRAFLYDAVEQRLRSLDALAIAGIRVYVRTYEPGHFNDKHAPDQWPMCMALGLSMQEYRENADRQHLEKAIIHSAVLDLATKFPRLIVFDVAELSAMRPDAHPGSVIKIFRDGSNVIHPDCQHWCIPGVPDTHVQIFLAHACAISPQQ